MLVMAAPIGRSLKAKRLTTKEVLERKRRGLPIYNLDDYKTWVRGVRQNKKPKSH